MDIKDRPEIKHLEVITELRDELFYMNKGHQTIKSHTHKAEIWEKHVEQLEWNNLPRKVS